MAAARIDILMYHSISENPGPTNIAPAIFADQMAALAASGLPVITLDDVLDAGETGRDLPERSIVITFDDAFQDFADTAWPILKAHGFSAINFLPTGHVGGFDDWEGPENPRPIMSWATIRRLASEGVHFGSHTVSHPHLDRLPADHMRAELERAKSVIEDRLGRPIRHFAPPYGAVDDNVRAEIARHYSVSVGTRLDYATADTGLYELPRIEMFYFTNIGKWRAYLAGHGDRELAVRRAMRRVRSVLA